MVSRRRLNVFAILFVVMLIVQAILGYLVIPNYKQTGFTQSIGNGTDPGEFIGWGVRTADGNDLNMDVGVPEGYLIDVYFMTYDNYIQMVSNRSFEYIPSASQMNVTHFSASINIDPSVEVYDIVVIGHESNPGNPTLSMNLVQSHLPAQLRSLAVFGQFLTIYGAVFFFFLVAMGYRENSLIGNPYIHAKPRTRWNSYYMLSLYGTLALFAVQVISALLLYWMVTGIG
ncbi:MAG TPA: hypothetical protein VGK23_05470 [Methanomassiliicoccales archaeon]|jgi:hypothetical protein